MAEQISYLDEKICVNEDDEYNEITETTTRLNLKLSTWMELYALQDEASDRLRMRDYSIIIARHFYGDQFVVSENGTFNEKFAASAPFHLFLTTVEEEEKTHKEPFSVTFHEIIDYTTGEIVDSLHLNFYVEILYIVNQYMLAAQVPKMTIVYGKLVGPSSCGIPFDVDLVEVKMTEYKNHHSKVSILKYKDDKIRIIISTANLYARDWRTRTQGLWISPFLPRLPETADDSEGESKTNFKRDFIEYLGTYEQPEVFGWQALIYRTDCSAVNVVFIASVPGIYESEMDKWGHLRLEKILSEHAILPVNGARNWPIIAQSSAVGVFGAMFDIWIQRVIVKSMCRQSNQKFAFLPEFKFIFPSEKNFNESYDSVDGLSCLMYDREKHINQLWIMDYFYQWKADGISRTKAMPHLKCYTRLSPDENEIPWFVLTSANLSKGAWGKLNRRNNVLCYSIGNYEAGVVFLPQLMTNQPSFYLKQSPDPETPLFRLPYDLPLVRYDPDDEPFLSGPADEMMPVVEESFEEAQSVEEPMSDVSDALEPVDQN